MINWNLLSKMLRIVVLSIVIGALHHSGASAQCGITKDPTSQNVSLETMVDLQCLTDLDRNWIITDWLFEEESVDRSKYEVKEDGTLTINSFDPSYAGLYRCVAENSANHHCVSKSATLFYFNEQSTFKTHPQDFVGFPSSPATFNCTYDDNGDEYLIAPTILWELNDTELAQDNPQIYSIFSYEFTSFLQIHDLSSLNGRVRCVVHSESGNVYSEYATFSITDSPPPDDQQPSFSTVPIQLMYLNKGNTVIAGCSVTAHDSIPLAWAFENNTEILFTGFVIHVVESIPLSLYGPTNLLINSSEYNYHNATYLCQLLSDSGKGYLSAPVTLFVYDSPMITSTSSDSPLILKKGDTVTLHVYVNMNTPASVRWFFNAATLRSSTDRRVEIKNEDNSEFTVEKMWTQDLDASLLINDVTCADMGFYQVEISNPVNTTLITYQLFIEDCTGPPQAINRGDGDDDSFPWWIILIILFLLLLLLLLLLLFCWYWRRRYVVYEAEKLENRYHKEYEIIRRGGSPVDATL